MSIAARIQRWSLLLCLAFVVSAMAGLLVTARLVAAEQRLLLTATALRSHVEADMLHDELRGHVYAALYARSVGDAATVATHRDDSREDARQFRGLLQRLAGLDLPPAASTDLASVRGGALTYVASAERVVALAARGDPNARRQLPEFERQFRALEQSMAVVSNRLELALRGEQRALTFWQRLWFAMFGIGTLVGLALLRAFRRLLFERVIAPLAELRLALSRLGAGTQPVSVECATRDDEIGELARGLVDFDHTLAKVRQAEADRRAVQEQLEADRRAQAEERERVRLEAEERRRSELGAMAASLEDRVLATVQQLRTAAAALQRTSKRMKASVIETRGDIVGAEGATEETAGNVTVAGSAAEEMSRAIAEISVRTNSSAEAAKRMAERSHTAGGEMRGLDEAMSRISDVSALISSIAQRTNLLALNASIEAARAGKAGTGFAVVAGEIKGLAARTAEATREITANLEDVRLKASSVGGALESVGAAVHDVEGAASSIAISIKQQSSATDEISDSIQRTISTTQGLLASMSGLRRRAEDSNDVAQAIASAADSLEHDAEALSGEIVAMIGQIRAA
ncbi:hypothetical protein HMF7854_11925 [Sphingomonas ginkgonis]|uniref:Methyl-accepting chemotaxis protein n=1 Tax=Sphingomonas ginkgonis TaxID=2315330 RepID=A0A3R9Y6W8_9SPHN|nr:methyl-accepting chemotaxis protein [Sphingomonas ginkgonis]RST31467.1 hypothetical protein HMF7854_11925 [Sphingomonas ginkgonis]